MALLKYFRSEYVKFVLKKIYEKCRRKAFFPLHKNEANSTKRFKKAGLKQFRSFVTTKNETKIKKKKKHDKSSVDFFVSKTIPEQA